MNLINCETKLMEKTEDQIKQHIDSFPVLPVTVARLFKVTGDPESSARDVMEAILPDQSLCLTILKIANSVLFGRPKKVDSLALAVTVLGFNEVERIALTKAIVNSFSKLGEQHKQYIDKHWTHSFVCAMCAKIIARDLQISSDTAFMGGLLHDIGKLVMLETFYDDYQVDNWMLNYSSEELLGDELEMFSFTHDQIGGQLLQQWFFPDSLVTAVAHHHQPNEAGEGECLALIIQLADILSFYCCNQERLDDNDIVSAVQDILPDLHAGWYKAGVVLDLPAIEGWYKWLADNFEQGSKLKEAFTL